MLQLLFALLTIELTLILTLSFANPLRNLLVKGLDLLKIGRGPLITKTVATTVFVVFGSTIYTIIKIQKRSKDAGGMVNPTDEVIMAHHLLEASLMGNYLLKKKNPFFFLNCITIFLVTIQMLLLRVSIDQRYGQYSPYI